MSPPETRGQSIAADSRVDSDVAPHPGGPETVTNRFVSIGGRSAGSLMAVSRTVR